MPASKENSKKSMCTAVNLAKQVKDAAIANVNKNGDGRSLRSKSSRLAPVKCKSARNVVF